MPTMRTIENCLLSILILGISSPLIAQESSDTVVELIVENIVIVLLASGVISLVGIVVGRGIFRRLDVHESKLDDTVSKDELKNILASLERRIEQVDRARAEDLKMLHERMERLDEKRADQIDRALQENRRVAERFMDQLATLYRQFAKEAHNQGNQS